MIKGGSEKSFERRLFPSEENKKKIREVVYSNNKEYYCW